MAESNILMVEGKDDAIVVSNLLEHCKIDPTFSIADKGGIENLLQVLPVQLKGSGVERVGIVVDADQRVEGRWQTLSSILLKAGYNDLPTAPDAAGTIVRHPTLPSVGIWFMPNNILSGMLEDFVRFLIPDGDLLGAYVEAALATVPPEHQRYSPAHASKAFIHTWLAWQEDPGTPMGLAITKKYLDPDAPQAAVFVDWIRRFFG